MKRLLALVLCLLLPFGCIQAEGAADDTVGRVQALLDGIHAYYLEQAGAKDVQAWIDDGLAETAASEWIVFGLLQSGSYDFSKYCASLLESLEAGGVLSASTRQKYALVLYAAGGQDVYAKTVLEETLGKQGIMSWVYGLHLITNGVESSVTAQQVIDELLTLQLEDGGWALRGNTADVDVTAMTVQALAPYADTENVKTALERAVEVLSLRQLEDGNYNSYGAPNPESAAQVVIALAALDIDAFTDARFIKNGVNLLEVIGSYRMEDGSFCHVAGGSTNANATVQTMHALIAWQRMLQGKSSMYLMDGTAETQPIKTEWSYKAVVSAAVAGIALIVCVVLLLLGKKNIKNYAAVILLAAAVIAFVSFTEFRSADEYYTLTVTEKADPIGSVTMSILCDKALGQTQLELPEDGVILAETSFAIAQGDTVYTILTEAARMYGIHLDGSGAQGLRYMAGISHLYEYACGDLSGWVYLVNGERASVGCDQYVLQDGDVIEWHYTLELGNDL